MRCVAASLRRCDGAARGRLLYARQTRHFAVSRTCCCMPVRHVILLYLEQAVVSRTAAVSLTSRLAVSWTRHCCISDMSFCFISERLLYLGQVIFLYLGQVTVSRTGHFCCVLDRLLCLAEVVVSRTGYSVVNRTCCCCCSSETSSAISRTGCPISDRLPYLGQVAVSRTGCRISDRLLCFGQVAVFRTVLHLSSPKRLLFCAPLQKQFLFRLFLSQTALSWSCPVWTRRCRLIYKFRNTVSSDSVVLANKGI